MEESWTGDWWQFPQFPLYQISASSCSPRKSHTHGLWCRRCREPKGLIAVNIRLLTGSSVKREWSFFLFWALNPRSQRTMPTGMIRTYKVWTNWLPWGEGRWRSVTASVTWHVNNLSFNNLIHNTIWTKHDHWPWKSIIILTLDYWIIMPGIRVNHHKQIRCLWHIMKATRKPISVDIRHASFSRFPWQAAQISFE